MSIDYDGVKAVEQVSLVVSAGESVALVGESGSGKTSLVRCIGGLVGASGGDVWLAGERLGSVARHRSVETRRRLQVVFQNPYASFNPRRSIGGSLAVPLTYLLKLNRREIRVRVGRALERVGMSPAYADRYPAELSGGERQRAAIARAIICEPAILVCDEVTAALDVSVQAGIVGLLEGLRRDDGLAILFVTHNLPLVRTLAERVLVITRGRIVETGRTRDVFESPGNPYTRQLIADTPAIS